MRKITRLDKAYETISTYKLDKNGNKTIDTGIYSGSSGVLYALHRYKSMLNAEAAMKQFFRDDLTKINERFGAAIADNYELIYHGKERREKELIKRQESQERVELERD